MEKEQDKNKTRRDFFKVSATVVTGIALNSVFVKPGIVQAETEKATVKIPDPEKWYGFGIDIDKCIGCGNCAKACKLENDVSQEPFYFRSWVEYYVIKDDETIKIES